VLTPDNLSEVQALLRRFGVDYFERAPVLVLSGFPFDDGGRENPVLLGAVNHPADVPYVARYRSEVPAPKYSKITGLCFPVSDDSLFIANLVLAFLSYLIDYPGGVPYDALAGAFPKSPLRRKNGPFLPLKAGTEYYSSNSFVAGLLVAAGVPMTEIPDPWWWQPGLDKPIPMRKLPLFSLGKSEISDLREKIQQE